MGHMARDIYNTEVGAMLQQVVTNVFTRGCQAVSFLHIPWPHIAH